MEIWVEVFPSARTTGQIEEVNLNRRNPLRGVGVMQPFEGTQIIIPAPPPAALEPNARNRPPPVAGVSLRSPEKSIEAFAALAA
jgi:hypothetical protein